jgi:hypothetical protein
LDGLGTANGDPGAQEEQELPSEWIEIPNSRREGWQIPAEMPSGKIFKQDRSRASSSQASI